MPFLRQEGRLLRARRAYTRKQNVTHWFLVGYILGYRQWHLRILRVANLVGCKDFLSSHELSSLTYITPNESWNALCSLYAEGPLWARNCAQKGSVNSVGSVREKNILHKRKDFPRPTQQPSRGNLTFHSPPYGGGAGGGASWCRVWGRRDLCKRRNCPAFLSCYFFVAKQRSSWYEKGY